jgi:hypothetical protein
MRLQIVEEVPYTGKVQDSSFTSEWQGELYTDKTLNDELIVSYRLPSETLYSEALKVRDKYNSSMHLAIPFVEIIPVNNTEIGDTSEIPNSPENEQIGDTNTFAIRESFSRLLNSTKQATSTIVNNKFVQTGFASMLALGSIFGLAVVVKKRKNIYSVIAATIGAEKKVKRAFETESHLKGDGIGDQDEQLLMLKFRIEELEEVLDQRKFTKAEKLYRNLRIEYESVRDSIDSLEELSDFHDRLLVAYRIIINPPEPPKKQSGSKHFPKHASDEEQLPDPDIYVWLTGAYQYITEDRFEEAEGLIKRASKQAESIDEDLRPKDREEFLSMIQEAEEHLQEVKESTLSYKIKQKVDKIKNLFKKDKE